MSIKKFRDEYRFLSNFVPVKVQFEGEEYNSVEHAYVAAKTLSPVWRNEIKAIPTAGAVKKFGKFLDLRPDWSLVRLKIMEDLVRQKFAHKEYGELLFATGEVPIIEGNNWHDNFWGSCVCDNCGDKGKNNLGKILMKIRKELAQPTIF